MLTETEVSILESNIRNVFLEESVTVSFPKENGIGTFSKTFKLGFSIDVPEEIGSDKTVKFARNIIRRDLAQQYKECIGGYKKQNIEEY